MKKDILAFINHILDAVSDIEESVKGLSKGQFTKNKDVRDSNVRRLEIIGEAVKNLPENFRRSYSDVPWKEISGMRDKLMHHYFGVNMDTIWKVIEDDLPDLKRKIIEIKKELEKGKK